MTTHTEVPAGFSSEVELITPEHALSMLETLNGPNRRTSAPRVQQYRSDMENGRWNFAGDPIRISSEGKLQDGKTRLTALAGSRVESLPFLVQRGLDPGAQMYMDQGQARTACQQLGLIGLPSAAVQSAAVRLYLDWTRGRLFTQTNGSTSRPEILEWVVNHQDLIGEALAVKYQNVDIPPSVTVAFLLAVLQVEPEKAKLFINTLASGAGLPDGSPILALDRRLRNIRRQGGRMRQPEFLAYLIKAWNAWLLGDNLVKIQLNRLTQESFPTLVQTKN